MGNGGSDQGFQVFVCYRRDDSAGHAGRLADYLQQRFGADNVFMDVETLEPGLDFLEAIDLAVQRCDVFLPMIGKSWLSVVERDGERRLDNEDDSVRLEVEAALNRTDLRIIPLLVQGATMPRRAELPESMRRLATRVAHELSDTRWRYDVDQLVMLLEKLGAKRVDAQPRAKGPQGKKRRNLTWDDYATETRHPEEKIERVKKIASRIEEISDWIPNRSTNQVIYRKGGRVVFAIAFWGAEIRLHIPNLGRAPEPDPLRDLPGKLNTHGGWDWLVSPQRSIDLDIEQLVEFVASLDH